MMMMMMMMIIIIIINCHPRKGNGFKSQQERI